MEVRALRRTMDHLPADLPQLLRRQEVTASVEELRRRIAEMRGQRPDPPLIDRGGGVIDQVPVRLDRCEDVLSKGDKRCPSMKGGHQCCHEARTPEHTVAHACGCEDVNAWETSEQDWPKVEKEQPTVCGARVGACYCERRAGHVARGYGNHACGECNGRWRGTLGKDFGIVQPPDVVAYPAHRAAFGAAMSAPVPTMEETPANRRPGCRSIWDTATQAKRCESMHDGHQCAWDTTHAGVAKDEHHCSCSTCEDWPVEDGELPSTT